MMVRSLKDVIHGCNADMFVIIDELFIDLVGDEEEIVFHGQFADRLEVLAVKYRSDGI